VQENLSGLRLSEILEYSAFSVKLEVIYYQKNLAYRLWSVSASTDIFPQLSDAALSCHKKQSSIKEITALQKQTAFLILMF
jgi:hypothetical protein